MASYGNTVLTSAGLDLAQRNLNGTTSFTITKVATSSDASLVNATISQITGLSTLPSVVQTGTVTAFDTSNPKQVGLKAKFTNDGLATGYKICAVGVYAKETGKTSEVLYAVAPAIVPEEMPARPDSNTASFNFTLQIFMAVGNPSTVTVSATTEGVVKSINGLIKPDTNGDLALSVGGRNLLTNTRTLSDVWTGDTETVDGFTVAKATQTQSNTNSAFGEYYPITWTGLTTIKPDTDYVLSFYAKASKQTQISSYFYDIGAVGSYKDGLTLNTLTTDYQRIIVHFHTDAAMPAGRPVKCLPVGLREVGVTAWFYGVQLEEGNVATQWQPNPADIDQAIANEATARTNADSSVLSQAKAYTDDAKSDLTTVLNNGDNSVLSQAKSYTDTAKSDLTTAMTNADNSVLSQSKTYADNAKSSLQLTMAGQRLDLVDGLDGQLIMGYGIPNTTWDGTNAGLTLPTTPLQNGEVLPQNSPFTTYYAWEAGKTYTQSIIIETDAQINTNVQPQWTWFTVAGSHNQQPAELINLGNSCYRLIGSYTPSSDNAKGPVRILDIYNFTSFVNVTTGTYLKFRSPHFFCADDYSLAKIRTDLASEATARTNADTSVLSQAKAYTDTAKSDLTAAMTNADNSVLGKANAYTDYAVRTVWTPTVITTAIDLNNIKACGSYFIQNTLGTTTNAPIPNSWLYVRVEGVPNRITQTVWKDIDPANQWVRLFTETWGNWVQITKAI